MKFPWKVGDIIICINNDHSEEYLTIGEEYVFSWYCTPGWQILPVVTDIEIQILSMSAPLGWLKCVPGRWNANKFLDKLEYKKYLRRQKLKKIECTKLVI